MDDTQNHYQYIKTLVSSSVSICMCEYGLPIYLMQNGLRCMLIIYPALTDHHLKIEQKNSNKVVDQGNLIPSLLCLSV